MIEVISIQNELDILQIIGKILLVINMIDSKHFFRRESSPPPSSSYRNDVLYQSPTNMPIRSSIDPYRTSDYANRSERYDISRK